MRTFGRWLGRILAVLVLGGGLAGGLLWWLAPRDGMDPALRFDAAALPADLDAWLAGREGVFSDILPGAEKEIVWAGEPGARTPLAVIYIHGFSATKHEIRPLPDAVAKALGANLYFARLAGHGRGGAAMAAVRPEDWMVDMAEALAIGRRLGERVIVIATSTGATLATVALADPVGAEGVAGAVFLSPNYRLASGAAQAILDAPFARHWGPLVAGRERAFEPLNPEHARWWTTRYPTAALFPMATLMRHARGIDPARIRVPLLLIRAPADRVVSAAASDRVAAAWGAPVRILAPDLGPGDDPYAHVVAGAILSPSQTAPLAAAVVDWARGL